MRRTMAIPIFLDKRPLKAKRRNGQSKYRWHLRWECPLTGKYRSESTGTADKTAAEELQKLKWAQVNGLAPMPEVAADQPEPEPGPAKATWQECRDAMQKAMQ